MKNHPQVSKQNLSKQLLIGFGMSLIAIGLGTLWVTYISLRRDLEQQIQQRAVSITQGLEFATEGIIELKETVLLGRIVQNYATLPTVVEVSIVNPDGLLLSHSRDFRDNTRYADIRPTLAGMVRQSSQKGVDINFRTALDNKPVIVQTLPFSSSIFEKSSKKVGQRGVAIVVMDVEQMERETWRSFLSSMLIMAVGTGVILLFTGWLIQRLILKPLSKLNQAIVISEQVGDFSLPDLPSNEIGFLGITFASVFEQLRDYKQLELEIAERKYAEVAERYKLATRVARVWVWDWNTQIDEFYIDREIQDLLGYKNVSTQDRFDASINPIYNGDRPDFLAILKSHLEAQTSEFSFEYRILEADGSTLHWFFTQGHAVRNSSGKTLRAIGTITDIAERKQVELVLQEAKDSADAANRAKSAFLARMSHELRTPLNAIFGFTQLMLHDDNLNEEQQEHLRIILRSGNHLLSLINDVLDMARIESDKIMLEANAFNLYFLLETVIEMLKVKAENKNLELLLNFNDDLPQYVYGDEKKLLQVLINLVGNAVKFTKKGSVSLSVSAKPIDNSTQHIFLNFEIKDTGIGIDKEEEHKLFVPFGQAESGKDLPEGTGLGLAISQRLVQLMGGNISFESELGIGSTFKFKIDAQVADPKAMQSTDTKSRVIGLKEGQPNYRILVVDDRDTNRYLLVKLLSEVGFEVREAEDGKEAIAIWSSWQPHLILMDIQMPLVNGYEATRQIRQMQKSQGNQISSCKIIAVTANVLEENRSAMLSAGCDDFIRKPYQANIIFDKITDHLNLQYLYEDRTQSVTSPKLEGQDDCTQAITPLSKEEAVNHPSNTAELESPVSSFRILVVEDAQVNQKLILRTLERLGYHPELAKDGIEAVDAFCKHHYDLILMDIQMPRMNGIEAAIQIRQIEESLNLDRAVPELVPIVAMTANNSEQDRADYVAAGMNDFVPKPINMKDLNVVLENLVQQKHSRE